ncbi:MAG: hypothetical protein ACW99Q_28785 [Candidatus Kariarchaeaceae archaeon]
MLFCRENDKDFIQGQMINISSTHAAFTCDPRFNPDPKDVLVVQINVPKFISKDNYEKRDYTRFCTIFRLGKMDLSLNLIVVKFTAPLPFRPGEQKFLNQAILEDSSATSK